MFDLGWSKLIIIAMVAIVVVGPKDLPPLLRAIGRFLAQMRRQAEEFRTQFNDAMKDTGLAEVRRDVEGIKAAATGAAHDLTRTVEDSTRPMTDAVSDLNRSADFSQPYTPPPAADAATPALAADAAAPVNGSHGASNGHAMAADLPVIPPSEIHLPTAAPAGLSPPLAPAPASPVSAAAAAAAAASDSATRSG
jgi:sec-independent protein translocase protein TatB